MEKCVRMGTYNGGQDMYETIPKMKILLISDQFYAANNGMTISGRRFAKTLLDHGHEVRVVSTDTEGRAAEFWKNGDTASLSYILEKQYIPVFDQLVTSQGMAFAKPDDKILEEAVAWADIIHLLSPFKLAHHTIMTARKMGKPYTAAFHVQPENITASIYMRHLQFINKGIYKWFLNYIYKYCDYVHCPSNFIAGELVKNGYQNQLKVISNGIDPDFTYRKKIKPPEIAGKYVILMIGRLSIEKRQDVLIKAVAKSKYKDKILLVLAGQGPRQRKLLRLGKTQKINMEIGFYKKEDLLDLIAVSDLYVHAADMEIEAMSCMEAFSAGLVPVISDSIRSATPQFALDERSLFKAGDSSDLARKIDYWIEHEDDKKAMEYKYSESARKYSLDGCVREAEKMFMEAAHL